MYGLFDRSASLWAVDLSGFAGTDTCVCDPAIVACLSCSAYALSAPGTSTSFHSAIAFAMSPMIGVASSLLKKSRYVCISFCAAICSA